MPMDEPATATLPPTPLITRDDVDLLLEIAGRLSALGYPHTGQRLHALGGRIAQVSKALTRGRSEDPGQRPAVAEMAGFQ